MKRTASDSDKEPDLETDHPLFLKDLFKLIIDRLTEWEYHIWRFVSKMAKKSITERVFDPHGPYLIRFAEDFNIERPNQWPMIPEQFLVRKTQWGFIHNPNHISHLPIPWQIFLVDQMMRTNTNWINSPLIEWLDNLWPYYMDTFVRTIMSILTVKESPADFRRLTSQRCVALLLRSPRLLAYCFTDVNVQKTFTNALQQVTLTSILTLRED
jgi:hypothetical protein